MNKTTNNQTVPAGWTRRSWIDRLRYLARICVVPRRAEELAAWADRLERNEMRRIRDLNVHAE